MNETISEVPPPGGGLDIVTCAMPLELIFEAGILARTCVELTKVVATSVPFQRMFAPLTNCEPLTLRVNEAEPASALEGESDVAIGIGLFTANGSLFDVPPPGDGLITVMLSVPTEVTFDAKTDAVNCAPLIKVVASLVAFQTTVEPFTKLFPVTVKANAGTSASLLDGDNEATTGTGLSMTKLSLLESPPPGVGFFTVTGTVPALAISAPLMATVSCVLLTNVVLRSLPSQSTTAPLTNLLPFTVKVKSPFPAITLAGESELRTGTGLLIENDRLPDVPPPGAGVMTETAIEPVVARSSAPIAARSTVLLT